MKHYLSVRSFADETHKNTKVILYRLEKSLEQSGQTNKTLSCLALTINLVLS